MQEIEGLNGIITTIAIYLSYLVFSIIYALQHKKKVAREVKG